MKNFIRIASGILVLIVLSGCINTPENVAQRETDAVATVFSVLTETAAALPPTETPIPASPTADVTATPIILPTILRYPETAPAIPVVVNPTTTVVSKIYNAGTFVSFNPVTNSSIKPEKSFNLEIRLRNTGTTIWNNTFKLVNSGGTALSTNSSVALSANVAYGGEITVTLPIVSPKNHGTYTQSWNLVDSYNAVVMSLSYNLIVGNFTDVPVVQTTKYSSQLDYMCSDANRSIQQGQGCEDYCIRYNPQKLNCYYRGTLNPTATPTKPAPAQPTPDYTQTAETNALKTEEANDATQDAFEAAQTAAAEASMQQTQAAQNATSQAAAAQTQAAQDATSQAAAEQTLIAAQQTEEAAVPAE